MESSLPRIHPSPLKQHPVPSSKQSPSLSTPRHTKTFILDHPSACFSSSPASSPRIIDSPPTRTRSVRPEMSHLMDRGMSPGADFFEDSSGDGDSGWEDDEGTRDFSEVEGLGIGGSGITIDDDDDERIVREEKRTGCQRHEDVMSALPPFNQITMHDSEIPTADEEDYPSSPTGTKKARQMSLRRLGRVRVVQNPGSGSAGRGTPRGSIGSNESGEIVSAGELVKPLPFPGFVREEKSPDAVQSMSFQKRHRRNTSESVRADSILKAHGMTLRMLEALPSDTSLSHFHGRAEPFHSKSASFSEGRHITLSPLRVGNADTERPAHLPSHFIKTPYPFTAKKEFPKPKTRPRQHTVDSEVGDYDNKKGKHVLGIVASDGEFDLRSRLERNEDAQGVIRSRSDCVGRTKQWGSSGSRVKESAVYLSLKKRSGGQDGVANTLEQITVPSSLTTKYAECSSRKRIKRGKDASPTAGGRMAEDAIIDFDDMFFAERLRDGYKQLAGPWLLRTLSARKLRYIHLAQVSVWSGPSNYTHRGAGTSRLLAARGGFDSDPDMPNPFTEHNLMELYRNPKTGKARYTWVHWARRVAASNDYLSRRPCSMPSTAVHSKRRTRSLDTPPHDVEKEDMTPTASDYVTTIQFIHSFSAPRILLVLASMLSLCVLASVLWILIGESALAFRPENKGRAERVVSGMLVGVLTLGLESVVFAAWVLGSWMWL